MNNKTRILIVTDSPTLPTGMAETTRLIFGALLDKYPGQYDLHQLGLFHQPSVATPKWPVYTTTTGITKDGQTFFPWGDAHGEKTFFETARRVSPDIVFAFNDPQNVAHLCVPAAQRPFKLVVYLNLDGFGLPPVREPVLNQADLIVTMSSFSLDMVRTYLGRNAKPRLAYLWSPADVKRFRPASEVERADLRRSALPGWMPQDAFLLGWVGRNQWRKQVWLPYQLIHHLRTGSYYVCRDCGRVGAVDRARLLPPVLHACLSRAPASPAGARSRCGWCRSANFHRADPMVDVYLWMHMPDEPGLCWPKPLLEAAFAVRPGSDVHYSVGSYHEQLAPEEIPWLYQTWDCLIYLSGGEGFGVPAWEAMCSGLPVIYTNYSSHAEYLGTAHAGIPVGGTLQPAGISCVWRMVADMPQALEAARQLYLNRGLGPALGRDGWMFAQQFKPETQAGRWHQLFQQVLGRAA